MPSLLAKVEASSMKFHVGTVKTVTLEKRNEAWVLDWKNTTGTPYLEIFLKKQKKTALTEHAAQRGHAFNWDYAHVLHHVNSYHKRISSESLEHKIWIGLTVSSTLKKTSKNYTCFILRRFGLLLNPSSVKKQSNTWQCL